MRPCTAAVRTLLDQWNPLSNITVCDLYTFTLVTGEVFRYSGSQRSVSAPAPETDTPLIVFDRGPPINRLTTTLRVGVEIDELKIDVLAAEEDFIVDGGVLSWQSAVRQGIFDGAYCELWRCFFQNGVVVGTIVWFYGRIAGVEVGRTKCSITVKSLLDLLNAQMPKRLFQSACTFVFGDTQCGFDREVDGALGPAGGGPAYAEDVTCTSGSIQSQIFVSGLTPDPLTLFNQGTIIGLTGDNTGYKRTITIIDSSIIYVLSPWIFPVVVGDEFRLLPGCDHTLATCTDVFNNLLRFGGFPYIPPPETAI